MNHSLPHRFRAFVFGLSLLCSLTAPAHSAPGDITTVAGTGISSDSGGDGGLATSTNLRDPLGVAIDTEGNVYFGEFFGNKIRKVDAVTGTISTVVGTGTGGYNGDGLPGDQTQIFAPASIFFGPDGALYFADFYNNRIRRYDPETGLVSTYAGTGSYDSLTPDGSHRTQTNILNAAYFAFTPNGDLIYGEASSKVIRKADATTGLVSTILGDGTDASTGDGGPASGAQTTGTTSMFAGPGGSIYFGERDRIRKIDGTTGLISTVVGGGTDRSGDEIEAHLAELNFPRGIIRDAAGNLFFGEDNARISKFDPTTNLVKRIAGSTVAGYSGENVPAFGNAIGYPAQSTFDAQGNLYFATGYNGRVRKIEGIGEPARPDSPTGITGGAPKADLLIGKSRRKMKGDNRYDQRRASRKQTLNLSAAIFRHHQAKVVLRMENDSNSASEFRLQTRSTPNPGISTRVFARAPGGGRRAITGAMKRRGYQCHLKGGESVRILYRIRTGRFWAGVRDRSGHRQNLVRFRASSGGTSDNCSSLIHFR